MGSDADENIVKILIQFGLSDEAARQALARLNELKVSAAETGASMTELSAAQEASSRALDKEGEALGRSNGGRLEMRRAIDELNRVMPGLGHLANLAAEGFRGMAESERGAAAATETLVLSLGPIAIIMLAIQAAVEYWDNYKEAAKEAAEETSKHLQDLVDATNAARQAQEDFNKSMADGLGFIGKVTAEMDAQLKILDALTKKQEEGAKNQADKQKIEADADARKIQVQKEFYDEFSKQQTALQAQKDQLLQQQEAADKAGKTDESKALQKQLDELNHQIEELERKRQEMNLNISTEQIVHNIKYGGGIQGVENATSFGTQQPSADAAAFSRAQALMQMATQIASRLSTTGYLAGELQLPTGQEQSFESIVDAMLGHKASAAETVKVIAELSGQIKVSQDTINQLLDNLTKQIQQTTQNRQ